MRSPKAAVAGTGGYRYRHFGAFRLLLAVLVMLQHFCADLAPEPLMRLVAPYGIGDIAVLIFFALSGFVITEAVDCAYRDRPGAFMTNRLLRIVPHFLIAVLASILAHALFLQLDGVRLWRSQPGVPEGAFALGNVLMNLVGIAPLADRWITYNFLDITWAVRVEMAFYLAIAVAIGVGGRLRGPRGFAWVGAAILVALVPAFGRAVGGSGPGMFAFTPYFAFGAGLYFATRGARLGWLTAALSLVGICVHFVSRSPGVSGVPPSLAGQGVIFIALLATMCVLAFVTIRAGRRTDQFLGSITYPLYLYHETVFVVAATLTVGYSYGVFMLAIAASLLVAWAARMTIDPLVDRQRDRIRGGALSGVTAPAPNLAVVKPNR
ncbi:MAG: acyltransferase [Rhodospirillales bacterium]|nr:acyltransferase [Rhodospirillales bacterium]